jgi:hypothetical protein
MVRLGEPCSQAFVVLQHCLGNLILLVLQLVAIKDAARPRTTAAYSLQACSVVSSMFTGSMKGKQAAHMILSYTHCLYHEQHPHCQHKM